MRGREACLKRLMSQNPFRVWRENISSQEMSLRAAKRRKSIRRRESRMMGRRRPPALIEVSHSR